MSDEGNLVLSSLFDRGYADDLYFSIADNLPIDQLGEFTERFFHGRVHSFYFLLVELKI